MILFVMKDTNLDGAAPPTKARDKQKETLGKKN
eukprot:CAMPEP_0205918878 /NCGR_PEP_ID=MMETSP1325-20131115/10066_1 /ASSEMBLY_ACC=CAM_ASM_000708 /TAXON_ID=236786 /ORGANISM="Florenciella sp., Strain RCC1007" /LENGTH=32 /DNA_ID= /DNA_START= /DNA_END= /DNA_ORIENTATION=